MKRMSSFALFFFALVILGGAIDSARGQKAASNGNSNPQLTLPNKDTSVRFAVIGDTGTGLEPQQDLANVMLRTRNVFPFEFALLLGDNLYGGEDANDYANKFEIPYKPLLDAGVKFYATLGNHDRATQRLYKQFDMDGKEFYSFKKGNVRFFALNSNYMDKRQLEWLEPELAKSDAEWKVCYFHHPTYSSGKQHGSNEELRRVLEPLFVKHGVNLVLAGRQHFYERIKPQQGIYYFISGAGAKLRTGDVNKTKLTEKSFDQDLHLDDHGE